MVLLDQLSSLQILFSSQAYILTKEQGVRKVKFSPKVKFIAITLDELILVPVVMFIVYSTAPEYLIPVTILLLVGAAVFVAVKYRLIYQTLKDEPHPLHTIEGQKGTVIETVTGGSGKIKVGAEIWNARCDGPDIEKGTKVVIVSRESFKVRVKPIDPAEN
jgi:membrane protein implicated in regulation of membrane protease activity